jgi:hypothetical protein
MHKSESLKIPILINEFSRQQQRNYLVIWFTQNSSIFTKRLLNRLSIIVRKGSNYMMKFQEQDSSCDYINYGTYKTSEARSGWLESWHCR